MKKAKKDLIDTQCKDIETRLYKTTAKKEEIVKGSQGSDFREAG